ncbi:MAG: SUMF1/EgtB/PvdO family nonheme iron enzyme [Blastocatellia bacterium]
MNVSLRQTQDHISSRRPVEVLSGQREGEYQLLLDLNDLYREMNQWDRCIEALESALRIARDLEDKLREAEVLMRLGEVYYREQRWRDAAEFFRAALQNFTEAGDERSQASTLTILGETHRHLRENETAVELLQRAFRIHEQFEDRHSAALMLAAIGNVYDETGRKPESLETFKLASQTFAEVGDRRNAAVMMARQGAVLNDRSRHEEALETASAALRIFTELDTSAAEHLRQQMAAWQQESARCAEPSLFAAVTPTAGGLPLSAFSFETVTLNKRAKVTKRLTRTAFQFREDLAPGIALEMVEIPGGVFMMGAPAEEESSLDAERPQHQVMVSPFYIGKFTVTQAEWRVVAGWPKVERALSPEPSRFKGDDRPVESLSWFDAVEFCARLTRETSHAWRLPTEAEWEYACRAGATTPFAFGETLTHEIANYYSEYPYAKAPKQKPRSKTIPAGSLGAANAFGLYDMHGNTREWCQDRYGGYTSEFQTDPAGPSTGACRVLRGGAWHVNAYSCRSADRLGQPPHLTSDAIGFRVVVSSRLA